MVEVQVRKDDSCQAGILTIQARDCRQGQRLAMRGRQRPTEIEGDARPLRQ